MAIAKRPGGLYYTAQGKPVDANGVLIADAPEQPQDTDPSKQPGSLLALARTPEERVGLAIARAMADPKGVLKAEEEAIKAAQKQAADRLAPAQPVAGASAPSVVLDPGTMTVAELATYLASLTTAEQVAATQKADKRKGVVGALYAARLEEIAVSAKASKSSEATASTASTSSKARSSKSKGK